MFHDLNFKFIFRGKEGEFGKCLISEKKIVKFQVLTILLVTDMQSPGEFLFSNSNKRLFRAKNREKSLTTNR